MVESSFYKYKESYYRTQWGLAFEQGQYLEQKSQYLQQSDHRLNQELAQSPRSLLLKSSIKMLLEGISNKGRS
ncbi:hypothetical protein [Wolbachia endosymbiont of Ctenocephalides felis wCfeJ]|uniref:hypothetical protein n=1 Tax=Wolbachia endosymbiont of Ctenocephalides felis wCfeJ TaxID=2732594 RepID=UPI001446E815|nr:hypothetical protein [Wolbachia endosymbiont of Ctenocephalides felis wCfeJ]WCR57573.1 MAG: hypothetical protein PG980_000045 [Wolbachia endosymbiont of Ctenocephalides felis wCfeJ]